MIQAWLLAAQTSRLNTVYTVLIHKYGRANDAIKNGMSHFYMFFPTKYTVKLDNGKTGHAQGIGIILCRFLNCSILYPSVTVYYCPGHPSNIISAGALKYYVGFQKVMSETLEHCDFVDPQGHYWISPY